MAGPSSAHASGAARAQAREHYADGERDGPAEAWYVNGQKQSEGQFKAGAFHGTWRSWRRDGSPEKVAEFVEGRKVSEKRFAVE